MDKYASCCRIGQAGSGFETKLGKINEDQSVMGTIKFATRETS